MIDEQTHARILKEHAQMEMALVTIVKSAKGMVEWRKETRDERHGPVIAAAQRFQYAAESGLNFGVETDETGTRKTDKA